jgi:hypothetical protein
VNHQEMLKEKTGNPDIVVGGQEQFREDAPVSVATHLTMPWNVSYVADQKETHSKPEEQ